MRRSKSLVGATLAGLLLLATACGDSTTGNTGDPLNSGEVEALVSFLINLTASAPLDLGDDGDEVTDTFDVSGNCVFDDPGSGAYSYDGEYTGRYDEEEEEGGALVEGRLDFLNCFLETDTDEFLILDGDPGIDVTFDIEQDGDEAVATIKLVGGVTFTNEDEDSGRCALNLTVDIEGELGDLDLALSGRACGVPGAEIDIDAGGPG
jgi:hypothetical protein